MQLIPLESLVVPANRQRREFDSQAQEELAESITRLGLFNPITIRFEDGIPTLVAGERRLKAIADIWALGGIFSFNDKRVESGFLPCVSVGDLDSVAAFEAELEENLRRMDLTWQERDAAIAGLHRLRAEQAAQRGEQQTLRETAAEAFNLSKQNAGGTHIDNVSRAIKLAAHLDDPEVGGARSSKEAFKILVAKEEAQRNARHAEKVGKTFGSEMHTLLMGDCREVMTTLPDGTFDVILTDPPYGMNASEFGDAAGKLLAIDHKYRDDKTHFYSLMEECAHDFTRLAKAAAHLYVCCDLDQFHWLRDTFSSLGWNVFRTPLINCKSGSGRVPLPEHGPRRQYEFVLYAHRGGRKVTGIYSDVINTTGDTNLGHGAQKPVELYKELLKRSVKAGDRVLDPFAGTGTIFPAAHAFLCGAVGIEQESAYFGIAAQRIEKLGGV